MTACFCGVARPQYQSLQNRYMSKRKTNTFAFILRRHRRAPAANERVQGGSPTPYREGIIYYRKQLGPATERKQVIVHSGSSNGKGYASRLA